MIDQTQLLLSLVAAIIATAVLRLLPFAALHWFRDNAYLGHLGQHLPIGVATILVVFTFKDIADQPLSDGVSMLMSTIVCMILYLWRHNVLLAVCASLCLHLFFVNSGLLG